MTDEAPTLRKPIRRRIAHFFAGIAHAFWSAAFVLFAWLAWRSEDDDEA